jgi:hypothetical protein
VMNGALRGVGATSASGLSLGLFSLRKGGKQISVRSCIYL